MASGTAIKYATFDVFTQTRLKGNPLAVVMIPRATVLDQDTKQAIAKEFNYSETVFLHEAEDDGSLDRTIDIFTTISELPFAGHPTIGSICCIAQKGGGDAAQNFTVMTKAGPIPSKFDGRTRWAVANIPHNVHIHSNYLTRSAVNSLFRFPELRIGDDLLSVWPVQGENSFEDLPVVSIVKGMTFILIDLSRTPDYLEVLEVGRQATYADAVKLDEDWAPSFVAPYFYSILSQSGKQPTRIRTRMMEPKIGEDPATGSAACTLGAYLALQNGKGGQSYKFDIEQGVEMGRASQIGVEVVLAEDGKAVESMLLSGTAVQVTEGTLML